jgi:hypothetical protein
LVGPLDNRRVSLASREDSLLTGPDSFSCRNWICIESLWITGTYSKLDWKWLKVIQSWMRDKKPYTLKAISLVHNGFLSLLSLMMFSGAAYGAYRKYEVRGTSIAV